MREEFKGLVNMLQDREDARARQVTQNAGEVC